MKNTSEKSKNEVWKKTQGRVFSGHCMCDCDSCRKVNGKVIHNEAELKKVPAGDPFVWVG